MQLDTNMRNVIPVPKRVVSREGQFVPAPTLEVAGNCPDAAKLKYLLGLCGFQNEPTAAALRSDLLCLVIGQVEGEHVKGLELELSGDEAYALDIRSSGIVIIARVLDGLAHGLKTLAKLVHGQDRISAMRIQDAPSIGFRGVHLCIFRPDDGTEKEASDPESIKKMLRLAAMSGYRYAVLEFWGMFPFQRHPYAVWPNDLYSPEVVRDIIGHALNDLHLRVVPGQNLTSHAGWSRIVSRKHVVLDQRPDLAQMWIPGGWCFATENPDTKAFLRDVMEEMIEAFRNPPMFHVGCDKAFGFGSTEEDRTRSADILFGSHLSFLNSTLQHHGCRMTMWADMLYSSMDALYWKASPALVDMLPRNILMNLWTHNDPGVHWSDVDFFESRGFQTIYSPFIDRQGVKNMAQVCLRRKSHGILQTTWHLPRTARSSVVFSGAWQWQGLSVPDLDTDAFISKWYRYD